ncbi:MAG: class I SAM-dependent methyltransferase [Chloroflexota bacterium]|nr:class I SAM-dependent methyltransferase [Chloroflexota bacterium]
MIDESRINPNLEQLRLHFDSALGKYFRSGAPIPQYFEATGCYNCGHHEVSTSFTINRFTHVRCDNCGMVYVNPRLKDSIAHNLYSEDTYADFFRIKLIPSIEYRRNVLAVNKFSQIAKYFEQPGKVLDVGSGLGEVLSVFQEKGWDCTGIELNEFAAEYARTTFGLNIVNRTVYDFDSRDKYDVIMLWGVLEHLYEPLQILAKVHDLLHDNGILVLEVPSADSVLVRYCEISSREVDRIIEGDRHLMLFSVKSFIEMPGKAGFHPIEIRSNGLGISTLNRLELNNELNLGQVNGLQALLDRSLQGDLLRGFFRRESS